MNTAPHAILGRSPDSGPAPTHDDYRAPSPVRSVKGRGEYPTRAIEAAIWFMVLVIVFLSGAAGYLFWAKLTFAWPFAQ
jgi:hypothetical protein